MFSNWVYFRRLSKTKMVENYLYDETLKRHYYSIFHFYNVLAAKIHNKGKIPIVQFNFSPFG